MTSDFVPSARASAAVDSVKPALEAEMDEVATVAQDTEVQADGSAHDRTEHLATPHQEERATTRDDDDNVEMNRAGEPAAKDGPRPLDNEHDEARTAAQQSADASGPLAQEVQDFADPDPTRGRDGKEYLVAGIYWSATSSRPRHQPCPSASSSTTTTKRTSSSSGSMIGGPADFGWRTVVPSKTTTFPPPVFHAETLLENEDETPFRLPFDILRDHYYHQEAGSSSSGDGRTRKGKGKAQAAVAPDDPTSTTAREGKGGNKTTEEDIRKREQSKKPDPYRYTSKNIYVGRGPDKAAIPAICMCKPPTRSGEMGCGDECINRMMQYCCEPKLCPCGPDKCGNPPLSKREGVPEGKDGLRVIWTGNRGFGLKTMVPIKRGEFVLEYRGEIISRNESYRRVLTDYKDSASYYFMDYDGFEVVDAGQKGNSARFINHSCGPNLEVVRWRLAQYEEYQMGLFALHDIPAGTELTYDYGWQDFSALAPKPVDTAAAADGSTPLTTAAALTPAEAVVLGNGTAIDPARQRCYCGAAECSGFLGGGRKKVGRGGGGGGGAANGAAKGDGGSTGANKGKRKGGAPPVQEEADSVSTLTRTDATEPQRPKLAFAQARIRVVDPNKPAPISAAAVESAPRPAKKPRSSSGATSRLATDEDLQDERNRVMGAMRSGREAAKKAAGKLVGSASGGRLSLGGGRR